MWLTLSLFTFSDKEKPSTCSQQRKDANRLPHWTYPGSTWCHHCGRAELPPVLPHITVRNDGAAFPEKKPGMKKYTFILNKARSSTGRRIFPLQVSADFHWAPDEIFVKWNIFPQLLLLTTSPLPIILSGSNNSVQRCEVLAGVIVHTFSSRSVSESFRNYSHSFEPKRNGYGSSQQTIMHHVSKHGAPGGEYQTCATRTTTCTKFLLLFTWPIESLCMSKYHRKMFGAATTINLSKLDSLNSVNYFSKYKPRSGKSCLHLRHFRENKFNIT